MKIINALKSGDLVKINSNYRCNNIYCSCIIFIGINTTQEIYEIYTITEINNDVIVELYNINRSFIVFHKLNIIHLTKINENII
jgi:hypothetical protein